MNKQIPPRLSSAVPFAFLAATLFSIRFLFFFLPFLPFFPSSVANLVQDGTLVGALLGNAEHLVLFPIIASLRAPGWAKSAGYGWLVVDIATDILALQGVPSSLYLALRYGGHISAAVWFVSASWLTPRTVRIIGILYAFDLALYSYIPHGPFFLLLPSSILLPLWLILVGRFITKARKMQDECDATAGAMVQG